MNDLSGKVVRGYELRELIGIGGYGGVYRAYQPLVDREVAIKIILPEYANRPYFIRNFELEAQIVARLEHLHIVPLYDYWRDPDGAYIVMRLLRGGSLSQLLRNGPLDIDVAVRMVEQIASALTIAHRHGVVHQDMKSANILLDEDQNTFLSDFGIAKDLTQSSEQDVDDPDNVVRGSPEYVSPEQILNAPIDLKTDIYSLGIMFFEMLTGTTPFKSDDDQEVLRCQLYEKVPPIQNFDPDLPDVLNIVIQRATDKHPKRRYPNALSMAEGLRQLVTLHEQSSDTIVVDGGTTESVTTKGIDQSVDVLSIDANLFTEPTNPYKGLRAFQEADTADFYGRNQLIARLQDRLQEDEEEARFLAVVGPSGSGKSSVIKAGLIPSLRKGALPGSENWYIQEMTPGANPIEELKETLLKVATVSDSTLLDLLYADQNGLLHALNRILPDDGSELFLLIDQFEEIFTVVPEEAQRVHFLSLLQNAVLAENTRLRLVATLRADFYDRPLLYAGFGNLMRQRTEVVLPLSSEELREAIVMPAERVGLQLEEGLADEILADVNEQPSALPMLQYALTELYMNRRGNTLTRSVYRNTGGVSGALTRRADEIYLKMSTERKEVARQVFLRLVTLGEGTEDTRRRALQTELLSVSDDSQEIQHVIDTYGKYRLLAFDREPMSRAPTVEIAHEALIREWRHLREWLDSNRDDLRIQRQLAAAAAEWLKFNRDASFLASGIRLSQFEILMNKGALALNANEKDYVQESARLRERNLRLRRAVIVALALISIVAIGFAIVAYRNQQETEKARDGLVVAQATTVAERDRADEQSRISRSRELSITALTNRDHFDLALLLNLEALDAEQTFNARSTLLTLLLSNPRLVTFLHGHKDWVRAVTFSPDGSLLATASRDNAIILWDVESRKMIGEPLTNHGDWVNTLAFSPDSAILASGGRDDRVILWDVATGEPIGDPLAGHTDDVWSVAFSPDGETLASGSADDTIILWGVQSHEITGSPLTGHTDDVYAVAFSPDGETLASGSADNTIRLWNVSSPNQDSVALEGHTNWVRSVAFSSDGALLASGSNDQTVRLWDVEAQQQLGSAFVGHTGTVREVILDLANHRIISAGEDGLVLFWDLDSGSLVDGFERRGLGRRRRRTW
jgi:WD40 repeat protein/serine/threonine protein kinase